jgi:tetratricopeptide (TPR) repeat protein
LAQFRETIRLHPDHPEALFKIGLICLNSGLYKEAVGSFEQARVLTPQNVRLMLQLAVAYEHLDMIDNAVQVYRDILGFDPLNRIALDKISALGGRQETDPAGRLLDEAPAPTGVQPDSEAEKGHSAQEVRHSKQSDNSHAGQSPTHQSVPPDTTAVLQKVSQPLHHSNEK